MEIKKEYPPNIEEIKKHFNLRSDVIFTYGDTLYTPSGGYINKPLMLHEETHSRQQAEMGVDKWWKKYIEDVDFRLEQELEAYKNQINAFNKNNKKNRVKCVMFLNDIARDLSGGLYGNIISFEEAIIKLKEE